MRPQTRPFAIEVKSRRRSAQRATAAGPQVGGTWSNLIPPSDLPEHGRHDDLAWMASNGHAFREASRVFERGRHGHQGEPEREPTLAVTAIEPQTPTPRVLPDLVAAAREQERIETATLEARKRKRASSGPVRKPQRNRVPARKVEVVVSKLPSTDDERHPTRATSGHAEAALRLSRRALRARSKLPPGQRWKERRLPRVCWDR
jgi:hypothetical protein